MAYFSLLRSIAPKKCIFRVVQLKEPITLVTIDIELRFEPRRMLFFPWFVAVAACASAPSPSAVTVCSAKSCEFEQWTWCHSASLTSPIQRSGFRFTSCRVFKFFWCLICTIAFKALSVFKISAKFLSFAPAASFKSHKLYASESEL